MDGSSDIHMEIWGLKNYNKKEWVLNYKIDMKHPFRNLHLSACGEWEHGIYFQDTCYDHTNRSAFFLDLTCTSMNLAKLEGSKYYKRIFSCTEGLISLKNYEDLVEAKKLLKSLCLLRIWLKLEKQAGEIWFTLDQRSTTHGYGFPLVAKGANYTGLIGNDWYGMRFDSITNTYKIVRVS